MIDVTRDGSEACVSLTGRITVETSPELRNCLLSLLQHESPQVIHLDLTEVPYMDCSGIATLIEALKFARQHQTSLQLHDMQERLLHLLEITGVLALFDSRGQDDAGLRLC